MLTKHVTCLIKSTPGYFAMMDNFSLFVSKAGQNLDKMDDLDKHSDSDLKTSRAQRTSSFYYRACRLCKTCKRDSHLKLSITKYVLLLVGQGD